MKLHRFNLLFDYLFTSKFLPSGQYIIYIHNSSAFDMVFMLKQITSYKLVSHIKPIIKDNKFINLEVFYEIGDKTYKLSCPKERFLFIITRLFK